MSIRRVDKAGKAITQSISGKKGQVGKTAGGEEFAQRLAELAGNLEMEEVSQVRETQRVTGVSREPSSHHRRQQLQQTGEILDSLEALGRDLERGSGPGGDPGGARQQLQESRDQALRALSDLPGKGEERDLLHRTAVLATVELAKSERGDYK